MNQPDALFFNKKDNTLWIRLAHKVKVPKTGEWVAGGTAITLKDSNKNYLIAESWPVYEAAKANQSFVTVYYQYDAAGDFKLMITPAVDDSNMILVSTYNQKGAADMCAGLSTTVGDWENFIQEESDEDQGGDDNSPK